MAEVYEGITDIEEKEAISQCVYSKEILGVTKELIIQGNEKIARMVEGVRDLVGLERVIDTRTLGRLVGYLEDRKEQVERVIERVYDVQGYTDVSKGCAKEMVEVVNKWFSDRAELHLEKALRVWGSRRLIAIGSIRQHEFLTYVIRQLMPKRLNQE